MKCIKSLESCRQLHSLDICVKWFEWREVWKDVPRMVTWLPRMWGKEIQKWWEEMIAFKKICLCIVSWMEPSHCYFSNFFIFQCFIGSLDTITITTNTELGRAQTWKHTIVQSFVIF